MGRKGHVCCFNRSHQGNHLPTYTTLYRRRIYTNYHLVPFPVHLWFIWSFHPLFLQPTLVEISSLFSLLNYVFIIYRILQRIYNLYSFYSRIRSRFRSLFSPLFSIVPSSDIQIHISQKNERNNSFPLESEKFLLQENRKKRHSELHQFPGVEGKRGSRCLLCRRNMWGTMLETLCLRLSSRGGSICRKACALPLTLGLLLYPSVAVNSASVSSSNRLCVA